MAKTKKPGTVEAWERGELGENLESAVVVDAAREAAIQEAAGLKMISIRLPESVIEDFKAIAEIEGVGYQPLMRIALVRFAECEMKRVVREYADKLATERRAEARASGRKSHGHSHAHDPRLEKKAA